MDHGSSSTRPVRPFEAAVLRHALDEYGKVHALWHDKPPVLCDHDEPECSSRFDPALVPSLTINAFQRSAPEVPFIEWAGVTVWSSRRWFHFDTVDAAFETPDAWEAWLDARITELRGVREKWREPALDIGDGVDEGPSIEELKAQDVTDTCERLVEEYGEQLEAVSPPYLPEPAGHSSDCGAFFTAHGRLAHRVQQQLGAAAEDEVVIGIAHYGLLLWCQDVVVELEPRCGGTDEFPFSGIAPVITDSGSGWESEFRPEIPAAHAHVADRLGIWLNPPTDQYTLHVTVHDAFQTTDRSREHARSQVSAHRTVWRLQQQLIRDERVRIDVD